MKTSILFRFSALLALLFCATVVHAQTNCVAPNAILLSDVPEWDPNHTYIQWETADYTVNCYYNGQPTSPEQDNQVTAFGTYDSTLHQSCNPLMSTETITSQNMVPTTFRNMGFDGQFKTVNGTYKCSQGKLHETDTTCQPQACPSSGGGGCCQCPPNRCPNPAKGKRGKANGKLLNVQACCCPCSPIIIDTTGNGFVLTNPTNGVQFDISGKGIPIQMAWTAADSGNAFLCLPDGNGNCDDGRDLFGSAMPQPPISTPNGFNALSVYDQPGNGGNGDGIIDSRDGIFSRLRLWIDANHDGISQPNELYTLPQLGITSISLNYKWDQRTDQYGNVFRYRAQIGRTDGGTRVAYDVFFLLQGQTTTGLKGCPALVEARKKAGGK